MKDSLYRVPKEDAYVAIQVDKNQSVDWNCKYIEIRFDMRDGGFTLRNKEGERINLEQLKWQYKSVKS